MLILAGVLGVYLFWVLARPAWLPKAPENRLNTAIVKNAQATSTASAQGWQRLWAWRPRPPVNLSRAYLTWATEATLPQRLGLTPAFAKMFQNYTAWLGTLSKRNLRAHLEQVAAFCRAEKIDLAMATMTSVATLSPTQAEAHRVAEVTLTFYVLANWQSREAQALAAYQAWHQNPHNTANQAFAQKLFGKLVAVGLATLPSTFMLSPLPERQIFVKQAIEQAEAEHSKALLALIKESMADLQAELNEVDKLSEQVEEQAKSPPATVLTEIPPPPISSL
jgi:hypothetical protein